MPSTPTEPLVPPARIACSICRKEIPLSSALTPQGAEYVGYFCGIECYQEFVAEAEQTARPESTAPDQK